MALFQSFNFKGFFPNFWVCTSITDNLFENVTRATVSLYKDRSTCIADKSAAIVMIQYTIPGVNYNRAQIDDYIRNNNPDGTPQSDALIFENAEYQIDPDFTSSIDNLIIPGA